MTLPIVYWGAERRLKRPSDCQRQLGPLGLANRECVKLVCVFFFFFFTPLPGEKGFLIVQNAVFIVIYIAVCVDIPLTRTLEFISVCVCAALSFGGAILTRALPICVNNEEVAHPPEGGASSFCHLVNRQSFKGCWLIGAGTMETVSELEHATASAAPRTAGSSSKLLLLLLIRYH